MSSSDQPIIALLNVDEAGVSIVATCKVMVAFVVTDQSLQTYAKKFEIRETMTQIRKLINCKATARIYCIVVVNVMPRRNCMLPECKIRSGWGMIQIPTQFQSMDAFVQKRKFEEITDTPLRVDTPPPTPKTDVNATDGAESDPKEHATQFALLMRSMLC